MTRAWSLLDSASYRIMPWKNGGGTTTEIFVHPAGAGIEGSRFIWRLSIATVGADGPFSAFPGYDRTIMLIEGRGMALDFGPNGTTRLDRPFEPFDFKGEWPAEARLIDGPCRDFNIMVDRSRGGARTRVVALGDAPIDIVASGMATVLFALDDRVEARAPPWLPPTVVHRHSLLRIDAAKDDDSPVPITLSSPSPSHVLQVDLRWT
jgi:environmental stress-induced protein Ves